MKTRLAPIALAAAFGCALAVAHLTPAQAQSGTPSTSGSTATGNDNLPPKLSDKLNHVTKGGKHHADEEESPKEQQDAGKSATNPYTTARPATDPHGE